VEQAAAKISIPGVDTASGIVRTGGTLASYTQVLSLFSKDAQDRLPILQKTPEADSLSAFITNVHALKSASASLGAGTISKEAADLEAAGKASDMAFIRENLPVFAKNISELIKNISAAIAPSGAAGNKGNNKSGISVSASDLRELANVLKSQNSSETDRILEELINKHPDAQTKEILEKISNDVLMAEFDSALKTVEELIKG